MQDEYQKPYLILFNGVTDALELIREKRWAEAETKLMHIQQQAEEAFINVPGGIVKLHQDRK